MLQQFGLRPDYVEQKVTATRLPMRLASLLDAEPDGPALQVNRRYVAYTDAILEVSQNFYPADRYSIQTVIRQRA